MKNILFYTFHTGVYSTIKYMKNAEIPSADSTYGYTNKISNDCVNNLPRWRNAFFRPVLEKRRVFTVVVVRDERYRSKHRECSHTSEKAPAGALLVGIIPNPYWKQKGR